MGIRTCEHAFGSHLRILRFSELFVDIVEIVELADRLAKMPEFIDDDQMEVEQDMKCIDVRDWHHLSTAGATGFILGLAAAAGVA